MLKRIIYIVLVLLASYGCISDSNEKYLNINKDTIIERVIPLTEYEIITYPKDSFEYYVQHLKLKKDGEKVYLYDGTLKSNQKLHLAVIDLDVGNRDLQQCADAIFRIRAEYLFENKRYDEIAFHLTNGFVYKYSDYQAGYRLQVAANETWLEQKADFKISYQSFREYLDEVFMYAGTLSLQNETEQLAIKDIKPGSFFVDDGHAVLVVNVAQKKGSNEKAFIIAQSYTPAQSVHLLKNFNANSPWYESSKLNNKLVSPEWTFKISELRTY
ncbi:DUF4846 domain-containing protein [Erysipelotrichaceae bacterium OttesenSCG-928-M19]|nr:DUF4846 domain-containing protein [Erysipelotrichaceae bacterium OttesenSCG-928-M19]